MLTYAYHADVIQGPKQGPNKGGDQGFQLGNQLCQNQIRVRRRWLYQRVSCLKLPDLAAHAVARVGADVTPQPHAAAVADAVVVHAPAADAVEQGPDLPWAVHVL